MIPAHWDRTPLLYLYRLHHHHGPTRHHTLVGVNKNKESWITEHVAEAKEHLCPWRDGVHVIGKQLHEDGDDGAPGSRVCHAAKEPVSKYRQIIFSVSAT